VKLVLRTIEFNHNPDSAATSAMNIRRNKDFEVPVPEYDSAMPRPPAESCAAYSIADTDRHNVVIRVTFAIPAQASAITLQVRALGGGIMGALAPRNVVFPAGQTTATVEFALSNRAFRAIGVHDISWRWQLKGADPVLPIWAPLVTTAHRIYLVLAVPDAPWTQAFADKRNPWTDLLDESCVRAADARTPVVAAKKLVQAINSAYALKYDIISVNLRYGFIGFASSFALSKWIDYVIRGNAPADPKFCPGSPEQYANLRIVNCNDCAASLALMAKVVGIRLEYFFHQPFGYLDFVVPIGRGKCNNPFYGCAGAVIAVAHPDFDRTRFANHTYTKLPSGHVFDACLQEWVDPLMRVLLMLVWFLILIITFGVVNLEGLLDRANGWLVDISQAEYEARVIDTSEPFESEAATGMPVLQPLAFQVT